MNPNIPTPQKLTLVYKVVQVTNDGRMWSANPSPRLIVCPNDYDLQEQKMNRIVEYKFKHIVFPNTLTPALFAFKNKQDGIEGVNFYYCAVDNCEKRDFLQSVNLISGYALNTRQLPNRHVSSDLVFKNSGVDFAIPRVLASGTVLCDSFIPMTTVFKKVLICKT
jgi:hypothetical protein